jgi:small-conductance mechanosensitive channel
VNEWLSTFLEVESQQLTKLLNSLVIILLLWLLRLLAVQIINHRIENIRVRYNWCKASAYVAVILGFVLVGRMWLPDFQSFATYLGLLTAGLTIALQGPITNLAGWVFILWRRPFEVGDRIQIGEYIGDVIDVRIFQFTVLELGNWVEADQSTGRILHIPNGKVFSEALANYTKGFEFIWHEIPVMVTFESNWEKAKSLLQEIADRHAAHLSEAAAERVRKAARRFMIRYAKLTPIVYTRVEASGVLLTIRYLSKPRHRRSSEHAIWEDILRAFAEHSDIEFAYPTQRFFHRSIEEQQQPISVQLTKDRAN